jgi:hypothetical protein
MADLMTRPEKMRTIDANADVVKSLVLARKRSV